MIDLEALPAPEVVEPLDYERILGDMLADYRARWPAFTAWVESEPALKLLEAAAYRELLLRSRVNDAARACMLAHAEGGNLDNLAALFGVGRLAGEADAALRRRVILSLGAHTTAGAEAGYRYHALLVDGVGHVCVRSPSAGVVDVFAVGVVEGAGAEALDAQIERPVGAALAAALSAADVRPITDDVRVWGIEVHAYRVAATITTAADVRDREAVRAASEASVRRYCLERHSCAPASIERSALIAALHVPGVESADLTAPAADVALRAGRAAWPTAAVADGAVYGGGRGRPGAGQLPEVVRRRPMDGIAVALA